jgi:RimJ/RimL family protein N-acetyltransferase
MPPQKTATKLETLVGKRVYLRPLDKSDLPHIQKWSNDAELRKLIGEVAPMSQAETERFYKELRADKDRAWFTVMLKKNDQVIGEAGLLGMFKPWRTTDMTIIIGEKKDRGKDMGLRQVTSSWIMPSND